jgi:tRNA-binding protein
MIMTQPHLTMQQFLDVQMHVGTVLTCEPNTGARKPAYILSIDFGPLGIKQSSAQITEHYQPQDLVGKQVIAVLNFPPMRVAGVKSEVLVLASVSDDNGTVLLRPTHLVANGSRVQ